ncbi:hypothetical protein [uncultured Methylobacterium sp.]|uniref:hypothetical protein n=1 Tax=uncultured Methylobacterium sp. TaxID=157278 RepID=UPI002638CA62|nr:hypothetical protein [uncultured Methylobacterium sp.]
MSPDGEAAPGRGSGLPGFDPVADLLFAVTAALLPAILILLPAVQLAVRRPASPDGIRVEGRPAETVVARAAGLRLPDGRSVALDRIPDDPGTRALLARLREDDGTLLVVVEPDGLESAFVLEPLLAAHGPGRVAQLRATEPCAASREPALARACTGSAP